MNPRLYLDEDVVPDLARLLRDSGYDAVSAHEVGATSLQDEEHLARAAAEGRAILTYNYTHLLDLSHRWFVDQRPHAGIIISYRQYSRDQIGELRRLVLGLLSTVTAEDLANTVRVLEAPRQR